VPHQLSPVPHGPTIVGAALAALLALAAAGRDFVGRYLAGTPEDRLVQAVLAQWAVPGKPFLDGVSGRDTVASVTATGSRSWEVADVEVRYGLSERGGRATETRVAFLSPGPAGGNPVWRIQGGRGGLTSWCARCGR